MPKLDFGEDNKFIALGPTYISHKKELERNPKWPDPWIVPYESVIYEGESIKIQERLSKVKPGVELTAVIGSETWRASAEEAWENVEGFTISNDVTATCDWPGWPEFGGQKSNYGYKTFPTFSPVLQEYKKKKSLDYYYDLDVEARVDGNVSVSGHTSGFDFGIPEMISFTSQIYKLQKGDLVALGDPGNVSVYIEDADQVTCEIESIGELINPVTRI